MMSRTAKHKLNPERTLAILVGVKDYDHFGPIVPAYNNVESFAELLLDKQHFGLPVERVHTILGGTSTAIKRKIRDLLPASSKAAKDQKIESLIFYFTGHGIRSRDTTNYFLASKDTEKALVDLDQSTAIPYNSIKKLIGESGINKKIVILDACHSGMAVMGEEDGLDEAVFAQKGTFTITSSHSTEKSYFDPKDKYSCFTGEFLGAIREGVPVEREMVDLASLYEELKIRVAKRNNGMKPQYRASEEITGKDYGFFRNSRFDGDAIKRREFEKDLQEYQEEIKTGKIRKAKRALKGLKEEAIEDLKAGPEKEALLAKIDTQIEICERYPTFKAIIEPLVLQNSQREIAELRQQLASRPQVDESALQDLHAQLSQSRETIARLQSEAEAHGHALERAHEELHQAHSEQSRLQKALLNSEESIHALHNDLQVQKDEIDRLQAQARSSSIEAEKTEAALRLELKAQQAAMDRLKEELAKLQSQTAPTPKQKSSALPAFLSLKKSFLVKQFDFEMIRVTGGSYHMIHEDAASPVQPSAIHPIELQTYFMARFPVTQALWQTVMGQAPTQLSFGNCDQCPVEGVSWEDLQEFLSRLNYQAEASFRLPTEAEWEFAASGGTHSKGYRFAGSNAAEQVAWHRRNSNARTQPVGQLAPNELGLHDLSGNVWEWCQDNWYSHGNVIPYDGQAWESPDTTYRVVRGGSWNSPAEDCRLVARSYWAPEFSLNDVGFRLVHDAG